MAISSKPRRGLQDINTNAGKVRQAAIPYKAFMRLSCLEMEKFRRARERASAMNRVNNIDARFAEIDAEKSAILISMGEKEAAREVSSPVRAEPKPVTKMTAAPFKLKY
mgnify:CR=1 FL=1